MITCSNHTAFSSFTRAQQAGHVVDLRHSILEASIPSSHTASTPHCIIHILISCPVLSARQRLPLRIATPNASRRGHSQSASFTSTSESLSATPRLEFHLLLTGSQFISLVCNERCLHQCPPFSAQAWHEQGPGLLQTMQDQGLFAREVHRPSTNKPSLCPTTNGCTRGLAFDVSVTGTTAAEQQCHDRDSTTDIMQASHCTSSPFRFGNSDMRVSTPTMPEGVPSHW